MGKERRCMGCGEALPPDEKAWKEVVQVRVRRKGKKVVGTNKEVLGHLHEGCFSRGFPAKGDILAVLRQKASEALA